MVEKELTMLVCQSIEEVRTNINGIDEKIVQLLAQREYYVKQAAQFKTTTDEVKGTQRVNEVISRVKTLANKYGLNHEIVERIYRTMIDGFICLEMEKFENDKLSFGEFQWYYHTSHIDWNELSNLYKIAPLGDKKPENLQIIFANSKYKCFVYDKDKLIGVGRALTDSLDVSYICDVAIHPEYQKRGIGTKIVNKLVELSRDYNKVILFTSMGKEPFYAKLGFDKMNTAMAIFKNRQRVLEMGLVSEYKS